MHGEVAQFPVMVVKETIYIGRMTNKLQYHAQSSEVSLHLQRGTAKGLGVHRLNDGEFLWSTGDHG